MYELYLGTMSDMATMKDFVRRIRGYGGGKELTLVMDKGYCSGANLKYLLDDGVRFVVPAGMDGKAVKGLLTEFKGPRRERKSFDDCAYDVWETEVALARSRRTGADGSTAFDIVRAEDAPDGSDRIKAFVCYETGKYSDEVQSLRRIVRSIAKRLDKVDSKDPMREFKAIAGKAARYFEAEPDGRRLKYRIKENAVSFSENRAGLFVMLAPMGTSWEEMMAAYDARRMVEQNFDDDKSAWGRLGTGDPVTADGREFLRFVSLILKCTLTRMMRNGGSRDPPEAVLNCMGSIVAMGRGDEWVVKNVCRWHRDTFRMLGIPSPGDVEFGVQIYTQTEIDEVVG